MIDRKNTRVESLMHLRTQIRERHPLLEANIHRSSIHNPWFDKAHYWRGLDAIAEHMLIRDELDRWCETYSLPVSEGLRKTIGLIFAGNIPLVGFHDFLSVYLSGHAAVIKLSSKDPYVFPAILNLMEGIDALIHQDIQVVDTLDGFDAVIATGSNNTNRYFEKYFEGYPSILRKNRTSVAILDGTETNEELSDLAGDLFEFYGLGCRNVTKLYIPSGYDFDRLLVATERYSHYVNNQKYKNNYDYNLSIELINRSSIISTNYVLLKEINHRFSSPVGMIGYEYYTDVNDVISNLLLYRPELQTVVGHIEVPGIPGVDFGNTQNPGVFDYPDGEDIGAFLNFES